MEPGYNPITKTYTTKNYFPYPTDWTPDQAVKYFRNLFSEFCFRDGDRERGMSVAIAAMLTLFNQYLLDPMSLRPIFCYTANVQGAGKTLLAKCGIIPPLGYCPTKPYPQDEDERRKEILSTVIGGLNVLFWDNIVCHVASPSLAALTTSPVYGGRILGESRTVEVSHNLTVFLTGNGCTFHEDIQRRMLRVDLFLRHVRSEVRPITHWMKRFL